MDGAIAPDKSPRITTQTPRGYNLKRGPANRWDRGRMFVVKSKYNDRRQHGE